MTRQKNPQQVNVVTIEEGLGYCLTCGDEIVMRGDKIMRSPVCLTCEKNDVRLDRASQVRSKDEVIDLIKNGRYENEYWRKCDDLAVLFFKKDTWTIEELKEITLQAQTNIRRMLDNLKQRGFVEKILCPCKNGFLYRKLMIKCTDCDMLMPAWSAICGGCYDKKHKKKRTIRTTKST